MAGLLGSILGAGKRTFDTFLGNDSETRVGLHPDSVTMPPRLIQPSNRTISSRVKTSEHRRTITHRRRGTPHPGFGRLAQPDKLWTAQNSYLQPNDVARDPR
jgi:hypothetical protein